MSRAVQPSVTVIMPVRNEGRFIEGSLDAVLAQDYPAELVQVLVVDGRSTDQTRELVRARARAHPSRRIELVDNPGGIVPTGFNAALARADGEVIVRVDGHMIVEPDYVSECVAALTRTGADCVGGRMHKVGHGSIGEAIALATSSPFGVGNSRYHYAQGESWVDHVNVGAWPRSVFDRVGSFDPEFVRNQDDEFSYRLRAAGGRILLTERVRYQYYNRASLRGLFNQYRQYGTWKVRVLQEHPRQMSARQFVPPAFVAAAAAGAALAPLSRPARRAWLGVLGSYALVAVTAAGLISRRAGWRHLPVLLVVFATLHISYGAGFLAGLVRFRNRWQRR